MNLKHLQHLVLLADELSFSRASERAHLSQTAFSRSIQALEQDFGMRLFDRDTRSVQVTATGRLMVARARELLARAQDLTRDAQFWANAQGGELHFGASLMAVGGVLRGVLPALRQRSPGLQVQVEVSQWQVLLAHLTQESIEFFVAYPGALAQDPRFAVTSLPPEPASVYCRASHPLAQSENAPHPHGLLSFPWATVQMSDFIADGLRALCGLAPGGALPLALSCDNLDLLREATLSSDTLLFTWGAWLQADLLAGTVVDLGARLLPMPPPEAMRLSCAIVQLAGRTPSPAAQRLMAMITEQASHRASASH